MAPFVESVNLRPYGEVLAEADAIIRGDLATALTQEHHNVLLLEDMRNLDMSRRRLITDIEEKRHWVKEYSRIIGEEMKAQRAVALQE
jgi:seryl-tRNA synthetase